MQKSSVGFRFLNYKYTLNNQKLYRGGRYLHLIEYDDDFFIPYSKHKIEHLKKENYIIINLMETIYSSKPVSILQRQYKETSGYNPPVLLKDLKHARDVVTLH